jgi:hypothetical protein
MSKQNIPAVARQAIWLAHNKKCAYSGQVLDLRAMHIDHIIPESVLPDSEEYKLIQERFKLGINFSQYGFENMLPCAPGYNLQKGAELFDEPRIHFFLGIAAGKKQDIELNIARLNAEINKGKAVIVLHIFLESGKMTVDEVTSILAKHEGKSDHVFTLLETLEFLDSQKISEIKNSEIEVLRRMPIKLGQNDHIDGVELFRDDTSSIYVRTCEQYDEAIKSGYYGATTFDIKMQAFFEHQCGLLSAMLSARLPEVSYVSNPNKGITDLHLIPAKFLPEHGENFVPSEDLVTYQDMLDQGRLQIKQLKSNLLVVEFDHSVGQQVIEVARADFDGNGLEDILLFEYSYAVGGSFGAGSNLLITRKAEDSLFERLDLKC